MCCNIVHGCTEDDEERERFWKELDTILDRVFNVDRLCVMGDLNG